MKFRVWCLSWDEDDAHGCDVEHGKIGEYIPPTSRRIVNWNVQSPADAAEAYADYCHDHRDGYEDKWPLKFRVRSEDGTVQDFEVDREMVAEFSASPIAGGGK